MNFLKKIFYFLQYDKKLFIVKLFNKTKSNIKKIKKIKDLISIIFFLKERFKNLPSSVEGHYNIITNDHYYKIIIKNNDFFLHEKKSILVISNKYPEIAKLLPNYEYYSHNKLLLAKGKVLTPLNDIEYLKVAEHALKKFKIYGKKKKCEISHFFHIKKGLSIIKKNYIYSNLNFLKEKVNQFFKNEKFRIGPCHGDFHAKNLLKDSKNNYYVIDLDCYRNASLQELDAVYFITELIAEMCLISWYDAIRNFDVEIKKNKTFYNFLKGFLEIKNIKLFLLIYFLDRVAQDEKYLTNKSEMPQKEINKTVSYFINYLANS